MLLVDLAVTSDAVAATSSRSAKVALLAERLAAASPDEAPVAVAYLSGELRQRRTGVGWASLRELPEPAEQPSLTLTEVDATFERLSVLSGPGSQNERRAAVLDVFARATAAEQRLLAGLVSGEVRQGALESLVVDATAKAAGLPTAEVRRAVMLCGTPGPVAAAVLASGRAGLEQFGLVVGRAVQPMLAQPGDSVPAAMDRLGEAAVEWKLDGIRVQVHRSGPDVQVFTRSLDDITHRTPEIVEAVRALPASALVLDGEAILLDADGHPRPFQETASRAASGETRRRTPGTLTLFLFDVLHLDGEDVIDLPGAERHARLTAVVPEGLRVPRIVTDDPDEATAFLDDALARGHEGVVVKALDAPYAAGRRGLGWFKVKPVHTLDLVVLAVEWGHGRRRGWLSNLHLGARDPSGGFVMLGKTFKGLTDDLLRWQTEALLTLEVERNDWQVLVRPELVVEIAFDGVQTSPRYPGGVALRFARVLRYRPDKRPEDADTIDTVRGYLPRAGRPAQTPEDTA